MELTAVTPVGALIEGTFVAEAAGAPGGADFADWLAAGVGQANDKIAHADALVQRLALGEADNLHQVMLALDDARLTFNLLVQVRNKLLEAYQDVMRMQV